MGKKSHRSERTKAPVEEKNGEVGLVKNIWINNSSGSKYLERYEFFCPWEGGAGGGFSDGQDEREKREVHGLKSVERKKT